MAITADQAFDLADKLRDCSVTMGDRLSKDWDNLSPTQRTSLENDEFDLLSLASRVRVKAVGIVLDGVDASVSRIKAATSEATEVIQRIKDLKKLITISAAAVGLAAAIASGQPFAIAGALTDLGTALLPDEP